MVKSQKHRKWMAPSHSLKCYNVAVTGTVWSQTQYKQGTELISSWWILWTRIWHMNSLLAKQEVGSGLAKVQKASQKGRVQILDSLWKGNSLSLCPGTKGWVYLPGSRSQSGGVAGGEANRRLQESLMWQRTVSVRLENIYTEVIWLVSESRCGDQWAKVGLVRAGQWKFTELVVKAAADCNTSLWCNKIVGVTLFCWLIEWLFTSQRLPN